MYRLTPKERFNLLKHNLRASRDEEGEPAFNGGYKLAYKPTLFYNWPQVDTLVEAWELIKLSYSKTGYLADNDKAMKASLIRWMRNRYIYR